MEPLSMGIGAALVGGALGLIGQERANGANLASAREQMNFQREMSNTAYTRAAEDMRNAGLNPILAAGNAASSPGGSAAQAGNSGAAIAEGASSAVAMKQQIEATKNIQSQTFKTNEEGKIAQANAAVATATAAAQLDNLLKTGQNLSESTKKLIADTAAAQANTAKTYQDMKISKPKAVIMDKAGDAIDSTFKGAEKIGQNYYDKYVNQPSFDQTVKSSVQQMIDKNKQRKQNSAK